MPQNPAAALLLASKANGLSGDDVKPYYLKAHYQTFDAQGKPAAKGIFELYWSDRDHYRVSYADDSFSLTTYHLSDADYVVGSTASLPYANTLIWPAIMQPVVVREKESVPELHEIKSGQVPLTCIEFRSHDGSPTDAYCLNRNGAILRIAEENGYLRTYNRIEIFQHRFSAAEISVREDQQQVLVLEQEAMRGMRSEDESALVPPPDARKVPRFKRDEPAGVSSQGGTAVLQLSHRVMAGHILFKGAPEYPATAKQRGAQGSVRISATIGKDGLVYNPVVVHDPDAQLSRSALNAVSRWPYTPYLLDGTPVEVQTTIRVTYRLGG